MTPEDLWLQLLECAAAHALGCSPVEHIRAAETLARSEGRREGLEEAARHVGASPTGANTADIADDIRALVDEPSPLPIAQNVVIRRDVAAYLLDRADQYETDSPCWIALADVAQNIMRGEVIAAERNGDFDAALYARVDSMALPIAPPREE